MKVEILVTVQLKYIIPYSFQNCERQDIQNNTSFYFIS
jgi:hypothetical protein